MFNWSALPEILIGFGVLVVLAVVIVGAGNRTADRGFRRQEEKNRR